MAVKGLRGLTRKENDMPEDITLTQRELDEIKDEERFKEKTTLLLKRIEEHQIKQNGSIEKAIVKIATNTSSVKYLWGIVIFLGGLVGIIFRLLK